MTEVVADLYLSNEDFAQRKLDLDEVFFSQVRDWTGSEYYVGSIRHDEYIEFGLCRDMF